MLYGFIEHGRIVNDGTNVHGMSRHVTRTNIIAYIIIRVESKIK